MNANDTLPTLAIIGAGNMGMGMVARWRSLGGTIHVCDIDPTRQAQARELGCAVHATPARVAASLPQGGLLIVCVVTAEQCREVLWGAGGAAAALPSNAAVMLCPTIAPQDTQDIAQQLTHQGLRTLDAPMSGGPARAAAGTMSLMVAADTHTRHHHQATLERLANPVFVVSERVGDGARTKLVNNLLAGINLVGASEALALAETLGLDMTTTLDVIERSSGQSWIGSDRMRRALAGDQSPRAHMSLLAKDTGLAMDAAHAAHFQGVLGDLAMQAFANALAQGMREQDDAAMLDYLRRINLPAP
jgi:L-threonate 2-dehydrogenase